MAQIAPINACSTMPRGHHNAGPASIDGNVPSMRTMSNGCSPTPIHANTASSQTNAPATPAAIAFGNETRRITVIPLGESAQLSPGEKTMQAAIRLLIPAAEAEQRGRHAEDQPAVGVRFDRGNHRIARFFGETDAVDALSIGRSSEQHR